MDNNIQDQKPDRGDSIINFCWSLGAGFVLAGLTYMAGSLSWREFKDSGKHLKNIFQKRIGNLTIKKSQVSFYFRFKALYMRNNIILTI